MRWAVCILCVQVFCCGSAWAQDGERRAEVAAATSDARSALEHDVLSTELQPGITVDQLLRQTGGTDLLKKAILGAEQVGGTRWIDDATCQVRLEIVGSVVGDSILRSAEANPGQISIPLPVLRERLGRWSSRSFSGTGTSTALAAAEHLQPAEQQKAWRPVGEEPRRQAIDAARRDAVARVLESIRPITMPDGKALGDALEQPAVDSAVAGWLETRSITSVEFRDDLEVRVSLSVDPVELWDVVRDALRKQHAVALPAGEAGWKRLGEQVERRMATPVGRSTVAVAVATTRVVSLLPELPPAWVRDTLDVEGTARSVGPLLRTARAAEAIADERLAARVQDLGLNGKLTVGDAARRDGRIAEAMNRALGRARAFKVEYNEPVPGAVRVKVSLRLSDLWQELVAR